MSSLSYYLKALNITRWVQQSSRKAVATSITDSTLISYYGYILQDASQQQGLLFADATHRAGEEELLMAMIKAMKLQAHGGLQTNKAIQTIHQEILTSHSLVTLFLGEEVTRKIFQSNYSLEKLRHKPHPFNITPGISCTQAIFSYSPAALLDNPALKKAAWQDLQLALEVGFKAFKA